MSRACLTLFVLGCGLVMAYAAIAPYHCSIQDMYTRCLNGTCDVHNSTCSCDNGYSGYDCGLAPSPPENQCLSGNCTNRGMCNKNGNVNGNYDCYCDQGYYGQKCELKRLSVDCHVNYMLMYVYPYGPHGEVFMIGHRGNCTFVSLAPSPRLGLMYNLSYAADCGEVGNSNVTKLGARYLEFSVWVELAHLVNVRTGLDYTVRFACAYPDLNALIGIQVGAPHPISTIDVLHAGNHTTQVVPVTMHIYGSNMEVLLPGLHIVGSNAIVVFKLDTTRGYRDMHVMSMTASDGLLSPTTVELMTGGCVHPGAMPVFHKFTKTNGEIIAFHFTIFKFVTHHQVIFIATVKVCETVCAPVNCTIDGFHPSINTGILRRKRAVGNTIDADETKEYLLTSSLQFQDQAETTDVALPVRPGKDDRGWNHNFTVVVVVAAQSNIVLIIVIVYLRRKAKKEKKRQQTAELSNNNNKNDQNHHLLVKTCKENTNGLM